MVPLVLILLLVLGTLEEVLIQSMVWWDPSWEIVSVIHTLVCTDLAILFPGCPWVALKGGLAFLPSPGEAAPPLHGVTFATFFPGPRG